MDKLLIAGYGSQLQSDLVNIEMQNGYRFSGNLQSQGNLINKIERELAADFIINNDTDYIIQNYQKVASYLTTPELKRDFILAVNEVILVQNEQLANDLARQQSEVQEYADVQSEQIQTQQFSKETQDLIDETAEIMRQDKQSWSIPEETNDTYDRVITILNDPSLTDERKTELLSQISNPHNNVSGKRR